VKFSRLRAYIVGGYHHFGENTVFSPKDLKMEAVCSFETLESASPHGVTTQKTNIDIFTAVRTSNLRE
jgi:hypothetical protein